MHMSLHIWCNFGGRKFGNSISIQVLTKMWLIELSFKIKGKDNWKQPMWFFCVCASQVFKHNMEKCRKRKILVEFDEKLWKFKILWRTNRRISSKLFKAVNQCISWSLGLCPILLNILPHGNSEFYIQMLKITVPAYIRPKLTMQAK